MPLAPFRFSAAAVHPLLSSSLLPPISPIFILFSSLCSDYFILSSSSSFLSSFSLSPFILRISPPLSLTVALLSSPPPHAPDRCPSSEFIRASSLFNHLPFLPFPRNTLSGTRRSNKRTATSFSSPSRCVNSPVIGGFSWPRGEGTTTASSFVCG